MITHDVLSVLMSCVMSEPPQSNVFESNSLSRICFILCYYTKYNIIIVTFLFYNMFSTLKNWSRPLSHIFQFEAAPNSGKNS
jgi:hypothetical protein